MLVEPTTIGEKALEQMDTILCRLSWQPRRALVTGAGTIGLLAAAVLALRGLEVTVSNRSSSPREVELVEALDAHFVTPDEVSLGHDLADERGPSDAYRGHRVQPPGVPAAGHRRA